MARLPFLSSGLISLELSPSVFMNIMKLGPTSLSASTDASRFASSISNRCCNRHCQAPILLWCIAFFWITCSCVHKVHITWSHFLECVFRCFKFFLLCCNRHFFTPSPIWRIAFLWIISIVLTSIMKFGPTSCSASWDASIFPTSISKTCCNRHGCTPFTIWSNSFFWIISICIHENHEAWS